MRFRQHYPTVATLALASLSGLWLAQGETAFLFQPVYLLASGLCLLSFFRVGKLAVSA